MASQLFSDGETYERLMGRWSRLVGKAFLAWLAPQKIFNGSSNGFGVCPQLALSRHLFALRRISAFGGQTSK